LSVWQSNCLFCKDDNVARRLDESVVHRALPKRSSLAFLEEFKEKDDITL